MNRMNDTNRTHKGINEDPEGSKGPKVIDKPLEKEREQKDEPPVTDNETPLLAVDTPIGPALEKRVTLQEAELKSRAQQAEIGERVGRSG